ncbi:MAG: thermonuclease family protein [Thermofilum sp.]
MSRKRFPFLLTAIFIGLVVFHHVACARTIEGKVVRVPDGDTIRLELPYSVPGVRTYKDGTIAVRLRGVDAPELSQPYGRESKAHLEGLVLGKTVRVEIKDIDRYGRIVGYVWVNGTNVNLEQVRKGYAWAYAEYLDRPYASEFYEAEKEARKNRLGLWRESNPTPPWEYRKRRR